MSTNGNLATIGIKCGKCGAQFNAEMPSGEIFNSMRSSAFISAHEKLIPCKSCGWKYVLGIESVQVTWAAEAVPDEIARQLDESRIILPGPGPTRIQ